MPVPPRIVILGGGFGGAYLAQSLEKKLDPGEAEVVLVDRNNYFIFTPFLVEAGTGDLQPRHAVVPTRSFIRRAVFRMAEITGVDVRQQLVRYRVPETDREEACHYDHLVVALGSVTRVPNIPGLAEYGFGMKSIGDAVSLRDRAIRLLEAASAIDDAELRRALLHFVVVGANFTGVEVAGEFFAFLRGVAEHYPNLDPRECHLTIVEMLDQVLTALGPELGDYAATKMLERGITVRTKTGVREVREREVVLSTGETIPAATVIWCAGVTPNPLVHTFGLPQDQKGYVRCERTLRVAGVPNVWAIGDNADVPGPDGKPYPGTAQNATQEAYHLADNLVRVLRHEEPTEFVYEGKGALAALGCRTGVAKVFGVRLSGFAAWFLWRTVYLMKMPSLSRKFRVAIDWTVDMIFRRDVVQLGVHREPVRPDAAGTAAEEQKRKTA